MEFRLQRYVKNVYRNTFLFSFFLINMLHIVIFSLCQELFI